LTYSEKKEKIRANLRGQRRKETLNWEPIGFLKRAYFVRKREKGRKPCVNRGGREGL